MFRIRKRVINTTVGGKYKRWRLGWLLKNSQSLYIIELAEMPNHGKCSHPWTVHTSHLLMSKNSIKNVLENLFLMFGRGKTQNRAKTHRPSMSAFSAIFVLKENGTQSHSAKFLNWGDHVNSVPDLAVSPLPWFTLRKFGELFTLSSGLLSLTDPTVIPVSCFAGCHSIPLHQESQICDAMLSITKKNWQKLTSFDEAF